MAKTVKSSPTSKGKMKRGLGRGLDSLFGEMQKAAPLSQKNQREEEGIPPAEMTNRASDTKVRKRDTGLSKMDQQDQGEERRENIVTLIPISEIKPNPDQPRHKFDEQGLDELASSIKRSGLIQPILVRYKEGHYQIIAGERRWRAAQRAHLHEIPAIIRDFNEEETLEISIVENVQRRDLNIMEEAEAYGRLNRDYGHSQADIARMLGKSRSHIANIIRLNELPAAVRELVLDEKLDLGHARALLTAPDPVALALRVVDENLSVRNVEKIVRAALLKQGEPNIKKAKGKKEEANYINPDIKAVEDHLEELLGLKISVRADKGDMTSGVLEIAYKSLDQLDMICGKLSGELTHP